MLFMGLDIGTQGVRAIAADENGNIKAGSSVPFYSLNISKIPGRSEQNPEAWWESAVKAIKATISELNDKGFKASDILSVSVDGTSGTILAIGGNDHPLSNGIMYNDMRSMAETDSVRKVSSRHESKLGMRFNPSYALPKILWIKNNMPEVFEKARLFIHQSDYIVGRLCGEYGISDYSNSLKTGYDLIDNKWPDFLESLEVDRGKLPDIAAPGEIIGMVSKDSAAKLGLSSKTCVTAGATDGYASALAAGITRAGNWATIIGTTMVLKGVSSNIAIDPTGSSYCHKLPSGSWMVGGASNVGGGCLNNRFNKDEFDGLDRAAAGLSPTGVLIYPLIGTGERYPFVDSKAKEFIIGDISDRRVLYTALMEGVGYVERLAYEHNEGMGLKVGSEIFSSGGACRSEEWLRIRASILNRSIRIPEVVDASMGSAMLAASKTFFSSLEEASDSMINFSGTFEPIKEKVKKYDECYYDFYEQCKKHFNLSEGI